MSQLPCGHTKKHHLKRGCDKINAPAPVPVLNATEQIDLALEIWGRSVKYQR